tara:strand:- start:489 stop:593 length:105 start_codon:yes stop_codon:yes gene_type:complete
MSIAVWETIPEFASLPKEKGQRVLPLIVSVVWPD